MTRYFLAGKKTTIFFVHTFRTFRTFLVAVPNPSPPPAMPRRSSRVESDSDDEGSAGGGASAAAPAAPAEKGWQALSEEEQDMLVGKVVRIFVMRQASKIPVKQTEISKALFPPGSPIRYHRNIMKNVLEMARTALRDIFSADIFQVVKQIKAGRSGTQTQTQTQKLNKATQYAADGTQTQLHGAGMTAYVLVGIAEKEERLLTEDRATRAFLAIIASIILLNPECRVEEQPLAQALETAAGITLVESGGQPQLNGGNVHELVTSIFVKQWYLEREKIDNLWWYSMGPRLRQELSDDHLLEFVSAVYNHGSEHMTEMDPTTREELMQRLDAAAGKVVISDTAAD